MVEALKPGPGVGQPLPGDQSAHDALAPLLRVAIAFTTVNTIFFALRFFTVLRLRARRLSLAWDDWLLIPAYLANIALCAIGVTMHDLEDKPNSTANQVIIDPALGVPIFKCIYAIVLFLLAEVALTRLSILALFLRIFTGKWTRRICYAMIAFIVAQFIGYFFASIFQCTPVKFFWWRIYGPEGPVQGKCYDVDKLYRSLTPPSIATDVLLILTPLPTVWRLNSSMLRKIGLTIVFSSGLIALIGSIIRQVMFESYSAHTLVPVITNTLIAWIIVEPSLYFITACLPALFPLLRLVVPARIRNRAALPPGAKDFSSTPSNWSRRSGHGNDWKPLVDADPNAGQYGTRAAAGGAKAWEPASDFGAESTPRRLEAAQHAQQARRSKTPGTESSQRVQREGGPMDVPLQDLRTVTEGDGVLVTKEIMVTQEQRIEDVIGF